MTLYNWSQQYLPSLDDEPHLIKRQRKQALELLQKKEVSIDAVMKKLISHKFRRGDVGASYPHERYVLQKYSLVFLDGCLRRDLSILPEKLVVLSLKEAARSYGSVVETAHMDLIKSEKNPFVLLHLCVYEEAVFLYLPPSISLHDPLHIIYLTTKQNGPLISFPRVHLSLGHHSSLHVVETHIQETHAPLFENCLFTCDLADSSALTHISKNISIGITPLSLISTLSATLTSDAALASTSLLSGPFHTCIQTCRLREKGSSCALQGAWQAANEDHIHVHTRIDHLAPQTRSQQLFKGIVSDCARSDFRGMVHMNEKASNSEASQYNHNLVLDNRAEAHAKPYLDILTPNVKASHGATCGKLNQEALFYMKTRGIPEKDAQQFLLNGFLQEVYEKTTS